MDKLNKNIIILVLICAFAKQQIHSQSYGCDFESYCDKLNFDSYWGLTDGEHPFGPNAPPIDHTFENSSGHYMFFDLTSGSQYKDSIVEFKKQFNFTNSNTKSCLSFYYIFNSILAQNFTVQLILGDADDLKQTWLTINPRYNQTYNWTEARIVLPNDAFRLRLVYTVYQITQQTDVLLVLDDVFVEENCVSNDYDVNDDSKVIYWCDFEAGNCSLKNKMPLEWSRVKASEGATYGLPNLDHTLNSTDGNYLSSNQKYNPGQMERIISTPIMVPPGYCLSFYYYYSIYSNKLEIYTTMLNSSDTDPDYKAAYQIWPTRYDMQFTTFIKWQWGISDLSAGLQVFSFIYSDRTLFNTKVAIDDIKIFPCSAVNNPRNKYLTSTNFEFKCDFETDQCGFSDTSTFDPKVPSNWSRITANETKYNLGPFVDNTFNNESGHFLAVNFSYPLTLRFGAATQSIGFFANSDTCIRFYYYANSKVFDPSLKSMFYLGTGGCYGTTLIMFSPYNNNTQGPPLWKKVLVSLLNIPCNEYAGFTFAGGDLVEMAFAIDDVEINRCDLLNQSSSDVTTMNPITTEVTTETTKRTFETTEQTKTTTIRVDTTQGETTREKETTETTKVTTEVTHKSTSHHHNNANAFVISIKTFFILLFIYYFKCF